MLDYFFRPLSWHLEAVDNSFDKSRDGIAARREKKDKTAFPTRRGQISILEAENLLAIMPIGGGQSPSKRSSFRD